MTPPKIVLFLLGTAARGGLQPAGGAARGRRGRWLPGRILPPTSTVTATPTPVADPYATVAGQSQAGRVVVRYGDSGLIGEGTPDVISQNSGGVGDAAEPGDRFGFSLAVGDVDCDEFTDLVVGSPYEDVGTAATRASRRSSGARPAGSAPALGLSNSPRPASGGRARR